MHYELCAQYFSPRKPLWLDDLTVVVAMRLHENNPWIIERLHLFARHYLPIPGVVVADFGSNPFYAAQIKSCCERYEFTYHRIDDTGIYSQAISRNKGAMVVGTSHIFFMDLDFLGEHHFFADILNTANSLDMANVRDAILPVPVYHVGEEVAKLCLASSSREERSGILRRIGSLGLTLPRGELVEFVAPYSNNFLCAKDFFVMSGGYNERFRGHGSEDFEFLLRWYVISGQFPLPDEPAKDCYGPMHEGYASSKQWRGFRRLLEAATFPAESAGLKMFHLWHERDNHDPWRAENDWKRTRFKEETGFASENRAQIINCNWLQPKRKILVLLEHTPHVGFFLPLRLTGCDLELFSPERANTQINSLQQGYYEAVAVFNPYMTSHGHLHAVFALAKKVQCPTIVIERGGLPDSTYYAQEVTYLDPEFEEAVFMRRKPHEPAFVQSYLRVLRGGAYTLESNGNYAQTMQRYAGLPQRARVCFIPLQLDDDIATTLFDDGHQPYQDFLAELTGFDFASAPDWLFFIKLHPLSKRPITIAAPNAILCQPSDNVHALMDMADTVICYNSGVGLLALAHQCSLKTVGNAYYNKHDSLGAQCSSFRRAVHEMLLYPPKQPELDAVIRLYDWLLLEKYSFFQAKSTVHEHATRRIHHYDDIHVYQGHAHGISWCYKPSFSELKPSESSYLFEKFQIRSSGKQHYELDFRSEVPGYGWHAPEKDGCWGGPDRHSSVIIHDLDAGQWRLVLHMKDEIVPGLVDGVQVRVNGREVHMQRLDSDLPCRLTGTFSLVGSQNVCVLDLESLQAVSPRELRGSDDCRLLTVKVQRLELQNIASFDQ